VNYPNLVRFFEMLKVPVVSSDMSFGASIDGGRLEFSLANLRGIFAQKRNLVNFRYLAMLRDILWFNAGAEASVAAYPDQTIGQLIQRMGLSDGFRDLYLAPMSGAIWSTPVDRILDFPAQAMISFFKNHNLLQATGQHQWYTVAGGSVEYVNRLAEAMTRRGVTIRLGAAVAGVRRWGLGSEVRCVGGAWERFDDVVMATHSDDSLRMLVDPTVSEREILGAIRYQPNTVTLHADASLMPKRRSAWASWVYAEDKDASGDGIDLTYWMNNLQPIPHDDLHLVTLNTRRPIREELIYDQTVLRHPVYDLGALAAQKRLTAVNGARNIWFCGAWTKNGFHEDGLSSGLEVAARIEQMRVRSTAAA
jgi:predicted NAD/FAD-binding protein